MILDEQFDFGQPIKRDHDNEIETNDRLDVGVRRLPSDRAESDVVRS